MLPRTNVLAIQASRASVSFVAVRINIVKVLQKPKVYNPITLIRPFSLRLLKVFTVMVTAEVSLRTLLLRLICSLSEPTSLELCCQLRLRGGPSAVLTGTTLPKEEVAIFVTGHYNRPEKNNSFFHPFTSDLHLLPLIGQQGSMRNVIFGFYTLVILR